MGLYPRLAEEFARRRITSLQVHYRHTGDMHGCVADVTAGLDFLESEGVRAAALVGHSLGGAVVIQAASEWPLVVTAVALATQSYGAVGPAATLGPRCSLMLAHGSKDEILPTACSMHVYKAAREPKRFLLLQGARHGLDEGADELADSLRDWIGTELRRAEGRVFEHSAG
jgi:dienelactone hydrolase